MEHVKLFSGVTASVDHDSFLPSWVVWQEGSDIENLSVDDDPNVILLRVFGDIIEGEDLGTSLRWLRLRLRLLLWLEFFDQSLSPLNADGHAYLSGLQVTSNSTKPASGLVGEGTRLLQEVGGGRVARHASEDDTSEQ